MSGVVKRLYELPGDRFGPNDRVLALTFDDGPSRWTTPIAQTLGSMGVPATFFVIGSRVAVDPDVVAALTGDGHTVGGHSWAHTRDVMSDEELLADTERTAAVISQASGADVRYIRPPYDKAAGARYSSVLGPLGCTTVTWSIDPRDWETREPQAIVTGVLDVLHPGGIVVMHDGGGDRSATLEALPLIVEGARLAGYELVAL